MKIVTARRISQIFFLVLFLWFCLTSSVGIKWWQLRGWPVNWIIQLDPLVGLGSLLTTFTIYRGLLWSLATVVITIVLGRFFCGWICPFGSVNHFVGFLFHRKKSVSARSKINRYRNAHAAKYWVLAFMLAGASVHFISFPSKLLHEGKWLFWAALIVILIFFSILSALKGVISTKKALLFIPLFSGIWFVTGYIFPGKGALAASLQTGLLDPIPLFYRSVNLLLLPIFDSSSSLFSGGIRHYENAWFIGSVFIVLILLNQKAPRFYCRFICPLGALFGILGRFSIWRIGKNRSRCSDCLLCEANCEGGCEPSGEIKISECILCMNCLDTCKDELIGYRTAPSANGEITKTGLSRREFITAIVSGAAAIPVIRLEAITASNWDSKIIRPPGSVSEEDFLSRCIKCGQCMRICPTNIIQPAGLSAGLEGLWTPVLNFRIGTSGCQVNCIACGNLCPTSAIRPISLDEKKGLNRYEKIGPIRLGTAFVDRGRCLPWAMDRPCIVCQENCPVSPKAIYTREDYVPIIFDKPLTVDSANLIHVKLKGDVLTPARFATGDYYCFLSDGKNEKPGLIVENTSGTLAISKNQPWTSPPARGNEIVIKIKLLRPYVDPERCTGCGICEHECPVKGRRAIRVSAENESRSLDHSLLLPL